MRSRSASAPSSTASGCSFTIDGQYDIGGSRWKDDLDKAVQVGAKLIIRGGYGGTEKQKELFYGFVDDYTFELTSEDAPKVHVTGVDALLRRQGKGGSGRPPDLE